MTRLNYLSQDRSDIQYATKELCRFMSAPKQGHWEALKRLGRYLKSHARVISHFKYQKAVTTMEVWTDSNFAGCKATRKSTSGGIVMMGSHPIKSWSVTQSVISLSSGEAEYYGMVKGASVAMGIASMLKEMGQVTSLVLKCDASAAVGIAMRR